VEDFREVGEFIRGNGLQKSDFTESGVPCIHYGQIYTFYGDFAYETKSFVSPTLLLNFAKLRKVISLLLPPAKILKMYASL
jgi:type I restriction enzyme S subunit